MQGEKTMAKNKSANAIISDTPPEDEIEIQEEEDLGIRYSSVDLPSGGKLGYPESLEYRDIMVRDEKIIASATEKTFPKVLNNVLKSLLKDQSYFEKLSLFDRDFLLLWIWANNYSATKTLDTACPHCGSDNEYVVDITKLEVDELKDEYKHPYPYTLSSGKKVKLRLLTVKDEEVSRMLSGKSKDLDEQFIMLCASIDFGIAMPLTEKIKKIENEVSGKDMAFIRGFHQYFKYGINNHVDRNCSSCGEAAVIEIPFQLDFFLPTLSNDFGSSI